MTASVETLDPEATLKTGDAEVESSDDVRGVLSKGAQMGRYVVLRTLGAGAMGLVYLAYDPELDRRVALKLLHSGKSADKRKTLLREAQAMAKLTHPNVVSVYDAGEHEGTVYVAMEFVEGTTLRRWLKVQPRSWREVVDKFVLAGRGLQAAHARELIHRDFKPDNVMVSDDGRVRVMDFGLARPRANASSDPEAIASLSSSLLTEATVGRVAGTPAYMAPEQTQPVALTPAVDQFSFCVSLWEGLCGERPFDGISPTEMLGNATAGRIRSPPARVRMPGWLKRLLHRGLAPTPRQRWPSMAALLDALERGRGRWRWQVALAATAALAVPVGLFAVQRAQREREHEARVAACQAEGDAIDEIWNDAARARLRDGLLATGVRFAADTVDKVVPWLDDYREAWRGGRTRACMHGTVEHDWDEAQVDAAMWCFEDRRLQLEATVDQIAGGDAAAARRAVRLASYLDPVEACLDPKLLDRLPAPPMQMREEIRAIRRLMSKSDKLRHGGSSGEALEIAEQARARAEQLKWPPLLASARFLEGRCLLEAGRFRQADDVLTETFFEAQAAGSVEVAFRAARSLMRVHTGLQRDRDALVWGRHAEAVAAGKVDPGMLDQAEGHYLMLSVYLGLGDYEAAAVEGEKAYELRATALGVEHPITAAVSRSLGRVYLQMDRAEDALVRFELANTIWEDAVGHDHPQIAGLSLERGKALLAMGRLSAAKKWLEDGLTSHEALLPAGHPTIGDNLDALGRAHAELGQLDAAEQLHDRAIRIWRERFGPRHRFVADGLLHLAEIDRRRGQYDRALQRCDQAAEILHGALDPDHPAIADAAQAAAAVHLAAGMAEPAIERAREAVAQREHARGPRDRQLVPALVLLGDAHGRAGRPQAARASYDRALTIAEGGGAVEHPAVLGPLVGLAELDLEAGSNAAALRSARRAVDIAVGGGLGPRRVASAQLVLAKALVATGAPRGEIETAAAAARDAFVTLHDDAGRDRTLALLGSPESID